MFSFVARFNIRRKAGVIGLGRRKTKTRTLKSTHIKLTAWIKARM